MIESIRQQLGDEVADVVEACSDTLVDERKDKEPWWDRKVAYLGRVANEPRAVVVVSAADKLHNARAILADYRQIGDELWERRGCNTRPNRWPGVMPPCIRSRPVSSTDIISSIANLAARPAWWW
jgi:hypothetical protein